MDIGGSDFVQLLETKVRRDGTLPVKVIQPGWGSSGFYPTTTLERDYAIFEGAQMFWNHPKPSDDQERPERDLRDLAAVLTNVHYQENGQDGPGVYGDAKVFSQYREAIEELAPYIGISILAAGKAQHGEVEGREGLIVEAITKARSVDFVTKAGAGGKVLQLFEAARAVDLEEMTPGEGVKDNMELKEALETIDTQKEQLKEAATKLEEVNAKLAEANTRNDELEAEVKRYREGEILAEAKSHVTKGIEDAQLPDMTKARIIESVSKNPSLKEDGKLDTEALDKAMEEAVKREAEYIASLTGSGTIRGMGGGDQHQEAPDLTKSFQRLGLSESAAKAAAAGRA